MEQIKALAIIESLRSGIPTINSTRNLPDLRPDLLKQIENDLKQFEVHDTAPSGRMIWGTYGQGKSHFLNIVEHKALDLGFAVSRITLNRSLSSKDFYEFFGELASNIKIPKTNISGIEWQLTQKNIHEFKSNHFFNLERYEHPLPLIILELFLSINNTEFRNELYDILTCGQFTLKKLKDIAKSINKDFLFRDIPKFKKENISSFFGVFAQCVRFCGFKGWVLLIDEVELLGRLSKKARLKAYMNLNWLLNWSDDMEYPIYTICASATSLQDYYWFGGNRKRKDDSILMPELAEMEYGIEARDKINVFFQNALENGLNLMPVNINEMRDYFNKLIDIYLLAYNLDIKDKMGIFYEIDDAIPRNMPIRTYIKGFIELLDGLQVTGKIQKINAQEVGEQVYEEEEGEEKQEQWE
jgi:hypothetical protein